MLTFIVIIVFILIGLGLTSFLLKNDKGEKEPAGILWLAVCLGLAGGIVAALLEYFIIPSKDLQVGASLKALLPASLLVGLIEESCKFLPLAFFIYKKRYFNEHTDGIIYFALVGLGFGIPENILYTVGFGASTGLIRIIMTPFFHAAVTALVGYFLIKAKLDAKNPFTIWPIFLVAVFIHGIYDFCTFSGVSLLEIVAILITFTMTINFFNLFFKASDLDKEMGLSVVGHNSYCRSCGYPNPNHGLYCNQCGNRA